MAKVNPQALAELMQTFDDSELHVLYEVLDSHEGIGSCGSPGGSMRKLIDLGYVRHVLWLGPYSQHVFTATSTGARGENPTAGSVRSRLCLTR